MREIRYRTFSSGASGLRVFFGPWRRASWDATRREVAGFLNDGGLAKAEVISINEAFGPGDAELTITVWYRCEADLA